MTAPEVTDWYSGDQVPAYEGLYKRKYPTGIYWCYWGVFWGFGGNTKREALEGRNDKSYFQTYSWRGLAEKA